MKVGIITFHRVINYGALLQAFALRAAMRCQGIDADIIDYRNDFLEKMYEYGNYFSQKGIKNKIRYIFYSKQEKKKRLGFENFRVKFLGTSCDYYTKDELPALNNVYDCFFTGSDQVWSPHAHKLDGAFLLDFVSDSNKKHSYAASFGVSEIEECYRGLYSSWLKDFSICSLREAQGISIVNDISGNKTRIDADPVVLLSKEDWQKELEFCPPKGKYAVVYSFSLSENQRKMAEECYKSGMKIYFIGTSLRNPLRVPCERVGSLDPREFAELIFGASFVITNSFHGTALSIVYNVPFVTEYLTGKSVKVNSRLENILRAFELENRVLNELASPKELLEHSIDWESVNDIASRMRSESLIYIKESVNA